MERKIRERIRERGTSIGLLERSLTLSCFPQLLIHSHTTQKTTPTVTIQLESGKDFRLGVPCEAPATTTKTARYGGQSPGCLAKTAAAGEAEGNHSWLPDLGLRRKRERLLTWAAAMGSISRVVRTHSRKCLVVLVAVACGESSSDLPVQPFSRSSPP